MGIICCMSNGVISQISQCIRQISHDAPSCYRNVHKCAHFCYRMVHCVIWDQCIVEFVRLVYCILLYSHYSDVTGVLRHLKSPTTWLVVQQHVQQTKRKHQSSTLLVTCEWNPLVTGGLSQEELVMRKDFLCHDIIMFQTYLVRVRIREFPAMNE